MKTLIHLQWTLVLLLLNALSVQAQTSKMYDSQSLSPLVLSPSIQFATVTPTTGTFKIRTDSLDALLGSEFQLDLKIENLSAEQKVIAIQFELEYDTALAIWLDTLQIGQLAETAVCEIQKLSPGKLEIAMIYDQYFVGSGTLLSLPFYTKNIGTWTPKINYFLLNTDSILDIHLNPVVITTFYGDVDGNNEIQAYDAALALHYSVGLDPLGELDPAPWESPRFIAADVNSDSEITAFDAALILKKVLHKIDSFPLGLQKISLSTEIDKTTTLDVKVLLQAGYLLFKASAGLIAFNLEMNSMTRIDWPEPEFNDLKSLKAFKKVENGINIGMAFYEELSMETEILKLKVPDNFNDSVVINLKLNESKLQKTIDLNSLTEESSCIVPYFDFTNKVLYIHYHPVLFQLFDARGMLCKQGVASNLKLEDFNKGVYFLKTEGTKSFKFSL